MKDDEQHPIQVAFERRNPDLDPQLVWRGKHPADWSDLVTTAPPLYIQEKVHPKALVDDLKRASTTNAVPAAEQLDLFSDFNGLPEDADRTDFYEHQANWSNRMILGDSLHVMASLAEREGLRGQVQCIYIDPPYGIKFNSNFQWSTTSRDVTDGKREHITREPEQVKAFRDTWRDGIHSYLTYLGDRLTVARDLLADSGSIFVQIGDDNVHRLRSLMDEVFGEENFLCLITLQKTGGLVSHGLIKTLDFVLWYAKSHENTKIRQLYLSRLAGDTSLERYDQVHEQDGDLRRITPEERLFGALPDGARRCRSVALESANPTFGFEFQGAIHKQRWKTNLAGLQNLGRAGRITSTGRRLNSLRYVDDFSVIPLTDRWESMQIGTGLTYVVQTAPAAVRHCVLMATDPGDLVLDPTCGSGTTAYVAEQWGRRWITIDTSRVALALARARIMGARYPYYLLADSTEGQTKLAEVERREPSSAPTYDDIRQGFVYERVPHIMLRDIANNAEIDVIWERMQPAVEAALGDLNEVLQAIHPVRVEGLGEERAWQGVTTPPFASPCGRAGRRKLIDFRAPDEAKPSLCRPATPRRPMDCWSGKSRARRPTTGPRAPEGAARALLGELSLPNSGRWMLPSPRKTDFEYLYDKPHEDRRTVRVAGPFTVESLSPHRRSWAWTSTVS